MTCSVCAVDPNKSKLVSSCELSLDAVDEEWEMPGFEDDDPIDDSVNLFQGSLGIAGPGVDAPVATVPKYELPFPAAAAPTVLEANLGVPSGEFWKAQTVGLDSVRGVPMGERVLNSGNLTDNDGVLGLNSAAVAFGLNSDAPALSIRGEPNGDDGAEDPGPPPLLELKPLKSAFSSTCANGSFVRCVKIDGDCARRGDGDIGLVGVAIPDLRRAGLPTVEGVRVRLNDEDRDSEPDVRGMGVGELKVCPVGATSSR